MKGEFLNNHHYSYTLKRGLGHSSAHVHIHSSPSPYKISLTRTYTLAPALSMSCWREEASVCFSPPILWLPASCYTSMPLQDWMNLLRSHLHWYMLASHASLYLSSFSGISLAVWILGALFLGESGVPGVSQLIPTDNYNAAIFSRTSHSLPSSSSVVPDSSRALWPAWGMPGAGGALKRPQKHSKYWTVTCWHGKDKSNASWWPLAFLDVYRWDFCAMQATPPCCVATETLFPQRFYRTTLVSPFC